MTQDFLEYPKLVEQAMRGVRAVYHICPNMSPDELTIGLAMLLTASLAGVEHFVYHSVLHPQTADMPHHWRKLQAEEVILASGLPFTILQPCAYMQNTLAQWHPGQSPHHFTSPYSLQARLSLVRIASSPIALKVRMKSHIERSDSGI